VVGVGVAASPPRRAALALWFAAKAAQTHNQRHQVLPGLVPHEVFDLGPFWVRDAAGGVGQRRTLQKKEKV
jgi:hypothetical protein